MREKVKEFISSSPFQKFIIGLILFNGVTLGLATSKSIMNDFGHMINLLDQIVVGLFTIEIILRIYVHRLAFFKDPWSLFDFSVVTISLIPAGDGVSILRVLRVLRLFRLLTVVPQMRVIISALIGVIPGIASVSLVLMLFFYIFAIMSTNLFGSHFPEWFGSLGASMYTLFQIMTLESWSMGIARPVLEVYPYAWIYFVIYILIVTFIMVNLFIGLIVDAIFTIKGNEKEQLEQQSENLQEIDSAICAEQEKIDQLQAEVAQLKQMLVNIDKKLP